jgi:putative nucleotidyltransferase with HDIG domain
VPEGLIVGRAGAKQGVGKKSTALELLAQHGPTEVTWHRIAAEKYFYLDEASEWSGFEFIYILTGAMTWSHAEEKTRLTAGDFIYHRGLSERAYFRVEEEVELLMVSSPPSYHLVRDELQDMMALARSVDEKDQVTEGHCHRIERLAIRTGERLGLSGQRLIDLSYGAYLHDIGKVRVPDDVLNKQSTLSDKEWEEMRRHVQHGADMLREKSFLRNAAAIVRAHHEKYDGSGYPEGTRGEKIPLEARIVAVVDAYDAMTTERPYQQPQARQRAIAELRKGAETQFDPLVVQAFLSVIEQESEEAGDA